MNISGAHIHMMAYEVSAHIIYFTGKFHPISMTTKMADSIAGKRSFNDTNLLGAETAANGIGCRAMLGATAGIAAALHVAHRCRAMDESHLSWGIKSESRRCSMIKGCW